MVHPPQNGGSVKFLRNWTEINHLLMAIIFKHHKYQTFGLMKMHNMCKTWIMQFVKTFGFRLTGRWKCYFLIFAFSLYPNFKCLLSKILQWIFSVLSNFCYFANIFDLHIFDNKTAALFIFLEICRDMQFVSLFFLNERNISTSLLMIHLKCTVALW